MNLAEQAPVFEDDEIAELHGGEISATGAQPAGAPLGTAATVKGKKKSTETKRKPSKISSLAATNIVPATEVATSLSTAQEVISPASPTPSITMTSATIVSRTARDDRRETSAVRRAQQESLQTLGLSPVPELIQHSRPLAEQSALAL